MISRQEIEERLKLYVLSLCLAGAATTYSKADSAYNITQAKNLLFDEVEKMLNGARHTTEVKD